MAYDGDENRIFQLNYNLLYGRWLEGQFLQRQWEQQGQFREREHRK